MMRYVLISILFVYNIYTYIYTKVYIYILSKVENINNELEPVNLN